MNDKRAGGTDIHDIIVAQFSGEDAWAKRPMSANIDASEENNESHSEIIKKRRVRWALTKNRSWFVRAGQDFDISRLEPAVAATGKIYLSRRRSVDAASPGVTMTASSHALEQVAAQHLQSADRPFEMSG